MEVIIYHNPACGTSRNTLAMIRNAGIESHVIEYLKTPPSRALLKQLIDRMGISVRGLLREKGTPYAELGLGDSALSDDQLLDAMTANPILINRPIVVHPRATFAFVGLRNLFLIFCLRSWASSSRKTGNAS
jgi:arsenate reductase (glutaredoxin)